MKEETGKFAVVDGSYTEEFDTLTEAEKAFEACKEDENFSGEVYLLEEGDGSWRVFEDGRQWSVVKRFGPSLD